MVNQKKITNFGRLRECKMRVMKRREKKMEMRSGFEEQSPSVAYACDTNIPLQKQNVSRRSSKGICVALIIAFVLTFAVVQTGAALELNWADGIWQNAAGTPTCLMYDNSAPTHDENLVAYGRRTSNCPPSLNIAIQSGVGFDGCEGESITSGVDFDLGNFTHYNNPIYINSGGEFTTVELSVTLSFYIDAGHQDVRKTLNYTFDLDETPNSGPCTYPGTTVCPDRVLVLNTIPDETFWIGGKEYTLHIVGFVPSGGGLPVNQFITEEGQRNDAVLVAELLVVAEPAIEIEKATNGIDADDPPGPYIPVGGAVIWTYNVTNIGTINLTTVGVIDNQGVVVTCPKTALLIGENMTCTAAGTATAGQYANIGNASGTPEWGSSSVSDTDPSHYFGYHPDISVTKTADPTSGAPSTNVNFTINVTNIGDCILNPVKVVDTLPAGMSYVAAGTSPAPSSVVGNKITWTNVGPLNAGASTMITLIAHIDTGASGIMTDVVNVTGTLPAGDNVTDSDTADVTALAPGISVDKTASPTAGAPCTNVTFSINVTNTGDSILNPVKVVDTLPAGMSYVAAGTSPAPSSVVGNKITWTNVGPLNAGASTMITLIAHIDTGASGIMTDVVNVTGTLPAGDNVTDSDTADVTALAPGISVNKTANPTAGPVGTDITFTINVTNTGDCTLDPVRVTDELQQGLSYVSSDPIADIHNGIIIWENVGPLTASGTAGDSTTITLVANIDEGASGVLNNTVHVEGKPHYGDNVTDDDIAQVFVLSVVSVKLEKTGSPTIVAPGGNVTYTIKYKNTGVVPLTDVVITEHYPKGVTFISASPASDAGTNNVWTIGTLLPGESGTIVIEVKVPEQIDLYFTETGSVIGEGLVMVTKDLSTEQKPYSLRNRVTLNCAELAPVSRYATTKVSGVPGTSLGITESGSGIYSSDEILDLETKNKTIILQKSTHAEYKPTSFNFSDSFSVNFTNKWKQDICSKNMEIDAAIHKKISDATYIDDETISRVDKDKSTMSFDSSFNGSMHIGARTKATEISETYIGEFDVLQTIHIAKGPIPTPAPTPTPIWLPCPYNDSQGNTTEDAEPTP